MKTGAQDEGAQDLTQMGVPEAEARRWLEAQQPEPDQDAPPPVDLSRPLAVWPENWPALTLLLRMQSQWYRDLEGRRTGLRFQALESAMNMMNTRRKERPQLFEQLVEMQDAALEVLHGV